MNIAFSFLSDIETPVSLFYKVAAAEPTAFLLESSDGDTRLARYSFIGISPRKTLRFIGNQAILENHLTETIEHVPCSNPLTLMQQHYAEEVTQFKPLMGRIPDVPFAGGWVGYMGYGATHYFDKIPQQPDDPLNVPDGYYGLYDSFFVFDHLFRRISFVSYRDEKEATALWEQMQERLSSPLRLTPMIVGKTPSEDQIFEHVTMPWDEAHYCDAVQKAKTLIREGDVFQIVVAHRFSQPVSCPPLDVYRAIQAVNPSPYSYYLKFPDFVYVGSSPETFVKCHQGQVLLKALAGTRPRGTSEAQDERLMAELRSDEKELAEHRMLVDLGRNDLGRFCEVGTVHVGEIAMVNRYTHVMHLATEVTGKLKPDRNVFDVFQSCFPRGTVSGAPKIRAMQRLSQIEPERRGIYSGVVGYFDYQGNMDGAIAIRSALIKDNQAHVHAGAGIVYDSDPKKEYEETRNKAKSILQAVRWAERNSH